VTKISVRALQSGCAMVAVLVLSAPVVAQEKVKQWVGALYPDSAISQGHNDAAKALAMVDDNPLIRWTHRVWCETGYHNINNLGTGQVADPLPDPERDLVSPNGFYYRAAQAAAFYKATGRGEYNAQLPKGGVKFMDNAWALGENDLASVVVRLPNGDLLLFDTLAPGDMEKQVLQEMPLAGLDPKRITHIFIGHSHRDHYGTVNVVKKLAPNAIVVAGAPDANFLRKARQAVIDKTAPLPSSLGANPTQAAINSYYAAQLSELPEKIDLEIPAMQGFTSGMLRIPVGNGQEVVGILNPGHSVGQISVIVPVTRNGKAHKLLVWSGNDRISEAALYARSADFARLVAEQEGADAWFNTHIYQQALFSHLRQVAADPSIDTPLIMGTNGVSRLLGIFADCQRAGAQRFAEKTWTSWQ
jgi:glyoxylase-like metal-dependent hydrolase (beta-lactamase superfamily II)